MESIIKIIISLFGLILMIPIGILMKIIEFASFGKINEDLAFKISTVVVVLLVVVYTIKFIYKIRYIILDTLTPNFVKQNRKKKIIDNFVSKKQRQISKEISLDKPFKDCSFIVGKLEERRAFAESNLNKVNDLIDNDEMLSYENNKLIIKYDYKSINLERYRLGNDEIEVLNKVLPISFNRIRDLKNRISQLAERLNEDIGHTYIEYFNLLKGINGEKAVERTLSLFENRYKVLKNIRVEVDGRSSESDTIVICEKGVFVIEAKNFGRSGQTIKITPDGLWYINNNPLSNVNDQNNYHCAINQILINNELKSKGYKGKFIDCNSILCIANDDVGIENNSKQIVVRASNILTEIKAFNTDNELSEEIQEEICNIFIKNNLPEKIFEAEGRVERIEGCLIEMKELFKINEEINNTIEEFLVAINPTLKNNIA